jgi:Fic family protein
MEKLTPTADPERLTELLRLLGQIDEFKGHWRKLREITAERLGALRQVTTIESTASSTRIEGAELSDAEVAQILAGVSVDTFRARGQGEVHGYGELLQTIFDHYQDIPLEERFLKQLHGILLGHSESDAWHRGEYKKHENHVQARHPDGRQEVVFRTAAPFDTPRLMKELVAETSAILADDRIHPLVAIARFIVEFLAIHPFQDGNGRLARALTALLLLRAGYDYVPYASLERVIEDNKLAYYAALRGSQLAMRSNPSDFTDWLVFFLRALRAQQQNLLAKLGVETSMLRLSNIQGRILDLVRRMARATAPQIAEALGLPSRTVRYHLTLLARKGLIEARGERRGRIYLMGSSSSEAVIQDDSRNASILGSILERGGRINSQDLKRLVEQMGSEPRLIGALHGRRLAHLRRDRRTNESLLTPRGREIAEQYLFSRRLAGKNPGSEA